MANPKKDPKLQELNEIRKKGFRPSVIACVIYDHKVLMVLKKEYIQWIFPQGGISNGELPGGALVRKLQEEVGTKLVHSLKDSFAVVGEDFIEFPPAKHGVMPLKLDNGTGVLMKGKQYYYCVIESATEEVTLEEDEYDDFHWVNYTEAKFLTNQMLHKKKKVMQLKIVETLKSKKYIK